MFDKKDNNKTIVEDTAEGKTLVKTCIDRVNFEESKSYLKDVFKKLGYRLVDGKITHSKKEALNYLSARFLEEEIEHSIENDGLILSNKGIDKLSSREEEMVFKLEKKLKEVKKNQPEKTYFMKKEYEPSRQTKIIEKDGKSKTLSFENEDVFQSNVLKVISFYPYLHDDNKVFWRYCFEKGFYQQVDDRQVIHDLYSELGNDEMNKATKRKKYLIQFENASYVKWIGLKNEYGGNPFEKDLYTVQFGKKIFDILNNKLIDSSPEYFITNPIPHNLSESNKTARIDELIGQWCGDNNINFVKDLIAYSCINHNHEKLVVFCHGPQNSGKSLFLDLLTRFLGESNTISSNLDLISNPNQRFETINLRNKKLLLCSETEGGTDKTYDTSVLKKLSGMDKLRGEVKGKQGTCNFTFKGKCFFATNSLPRIKDTTDDAFMGRTVLLDFPNSFKKSGSVKSLIETIPSSEYNNLATFCLERIQEWTNKDRIDIRGLKSIDERIKIYKEITNPIINFINDNYIVTEDDYDEVLTSDFFDGYNSYLQERGLKSLKSWDIGREIKRCSLLKNCKKTRKGEGNNRYHVYKGIRKNTKIESEGISAISFPAKPMINGQIKDLETGKQKVLK